MHIEIPSISPSDLVKYAKEKADLTYVDSDFETWEFGDYGGKRFEVLLWSPNKPVSSEEVRKHFKELNADGNVGAFTAWVAEMSPKGYHASIPSDDGACWRRDDGYLFVPYSYFGGGDRRLYHLWLGYDWYSGWSFVGFREVSSSQSLSPSALIKAL